MGILDKKSRIMDVIVTPEGRRQMHAGDFRAEFVSFSDSKAYYSKDSVTGSIAEDATLRLYFEANQLPIDKIVFETDEDGQLLGSDIDPNVKLFGNGGILKRDETGSFQRVTGSSFLQTAIGMTTSSIDNMSKFDIICSSNSNSYNMDIGSDNKIKFDIANKLPFGNLPIKNIKDIENLEPIAYDPDLNHIKQFKFLPPIDKNENQYGNYRNNGSIKNINNFNDIIEKIGDLPDDPAGSLNSLSKYKSSFLKREEAAIQDILNQNNKLTLNKEKNVQKKSFVFKNSNFSANFITQIYELNATNSSINRLYFVDAGEFIDENDPSRKHKHVFYAGKIFKDKFDVPVFARIFTLVFD
jgi:hypothetical protein